MLKCLKAYIKHLFSRPKSPTQQLLSYNLEELSAQMQRLSVELYRLRTDDAIKTLKKVIDTAKNIQLLEFNRIKPTAEAMSHHLGRLEALSDLSNYFASSFDPDNYDRNKETPEKKPKLLLRTNQRSGPVI